MITQDEFRQLARFYPVLTQMSPPVQAALAADGQRLALPRDRLLFDMESRCASFLMLTAGSIRVTRLAAAGREILLYRLEPGDSCILTVSCLLGQADYPARGVVETDLVGYAISRPMFNRLLAESEPFRAFVFHFFAERVANLMALLEGVAFGQLDQRLAELLGKRGPVIQTTHQKLADELGSVREVVSRILKDFESQSLVQLQRGRIRVVDQQALAQIASPLRDSSH
jgi:CRP/FNR family transcriptional regulator